MSHKLFAESLLVQTSAPNGRGRMTYHLDQLKLQMRGIERVQFLLGVGLPELDAGHCGDVN